MSLSQQHPNFALLNRPGSRAQLETPALVLDLDALESNIAEMARRAAAWGIGLRPHAKTHKSADIAKLQVAAGAVGVCVAKLGEAVALRAEGIRDILVTSPVISEAKIDLAASLQAAGPGLMLVVDNPEMVGRLSAAAARADTVLHVLVDLGMGRNRTGAATPESAASLASLVAGTAGLKFRGLQAYAGHVQHIEDEEQRQVAATAAQDRIQAAVAQIRQRGLGCDIVTGGGTGTHAMDGASGVFTDLQVGSYVFMDVEYLRVHPLRDGAFRTSLFVRTTVISSNTPERSTTDAGYKSFAMDGPRPEIASGAAQGSRYDFMGDEHGCVLPPEGQRPPPVGTVLDVTTPHCDPTVNLYDAYHCVRAAELVAMWPVHARGRSW